MLDTNDLGCPRGGGSGGGGRTRLLHRHQVICLPVDTNAVYQFQLQPWLEKESVLKEVVMRGLLAEGGIIKGHQTRNLLDATL